MYRRAEEAIRLLSNYKHTLRAHRFAENYPFEMERRQSYIDNLVLQLLIYIKKPSNDVIALIRDDIQETLEHRFYPEIKRESDSDSSFQDFSALLNQVKLCCR